MRRFPLVLALTVIAGCSGSDSPEPGNGVIAVRLTPNNPVILDNATLSFVAVTISETGEAKDVTDSPGTTWLSSDSGVLTINADGTAEAGDVGTSYVTARVSGVTSPAQLVTVNAAPTPTPTPTPPPIATHVVISEVLYSAVSDPGGEFVEILNPTGSPVDISGWTLTRDGTALAIYFTFPAATTLNAGAYAVVCRDPVTCAIGGALDSPNITAFPGTTGEWIKLRDATTALVDEMAYGSGDTTGKPTSWCVDNNPAANATVGNSVQRKPTGGDSDVCTNWISNTAPTPAGPTL